MGHVVMGVLYGARVPSRVRLHSDRAETKGLMPHWRRSRTNGIDSVEIDVSYESGHAMIGCWLPIDASDRRAWRIETLRDDRAYRAARKHWLCFSKWARDVHGARFPRAELWIAPREVA